MMRKNIWLLTVVVCLSGLLSLTKATASNKATGTVPVQLTNEAIETRIHGLFKQSQYDDALSQMLDYHKTWGKREPLLSHILLGDCYANLAVTTEDDAKKKAYFQHADTAYTYYAEHYNHRKILYEFFRRHGQCLYLWSCCVETCDVRKERLERAKTSLTHYLKLAGPFRQKHQKQQEIALAKDAQTKVEAALKDLNQPTKPRNASTTIELQALP